MPEKAEHQDEGLSPNKRRLSKCLAERASGRIRRAEPSRHEEDMSIGELCATYLEMLGVRPQFMQESDPSFAEMRKHLAEDNGLIISNHTFFPDTIVQLSTLGNRTDILAWTARRDTAERNDILFNHARRRFETLITPRVRSELPGQIQRIVEHIEQDQGLFRFYPTGQQDSSDAAFVKNGYRGGFSQIIEKVSDDTMVYVFYVDPDAINVVREGLNRRVMKAIAGASSPEVVVPMYERYTTAGEWKELLTSLKRLDLAARGKALAQHHLQMFGRAIGYRA